MDTPPQPPRAVHKEPSRILVEKQEWRKHAQKVQAYDSKHAADKDDPGRRVTTHNRNDPQQQTRRTLRWQKGALQEEEAGRYVANVYHSTHYTWWNFIPKNLYQQFRRFTNVYFLLVTLLTLTPFSPIPPYTSILPLVVVLTISAVSAAIEDLRRYRSDRAVNTAPFYVLQPGAPRWNLQEIKSEDIKVGSLLYLEGGDSLPADAVLLKTSSEDGRCFLQTTQLDGETNLKPHHAPATLQKRPREELAALDARMETAPPTAAFTFSGSLSVQGAETIPLNYGNFLARGTLLRNTDWVVAGVVYTGPDTKMSLNVRPPPNKFSSIDHRMNRVVIVLFSFMFALIIAIVLASFFFEQASSPNKWYLLNPFTGRTSDPLWLIILRRFVAYFVLLSFIVPQSLMVMLDLCKAGQAAFIQWDRKMPGAIAKSIGVNDELGRVQFLFSDKTGTLTVNEMRFRRASAGGQFYESEQQLAAEVAKEGAKGPAFDMLLGIALCHDAIAVPAHDNKRHKSEKRLVPEQPVDVADDESDDDDDPSPQEEPEPQVSKSGLMHRSSSPDEEALLRAAARLGFELIENKPAEVSVKIRDRDVRMQKLAVIPFNSARKRMSVIVRLDNGHARLICKGADSAVLPRLKGGSAYVNEMTEHVERMAVESGLRTLVLASRDLTQQQLDSWLSRWQEAQKLTDEDEKNRRSSALADDIEREMEPVGATGIEDRLQRGVPQTIAALRAAGIRVWVITGDKPETAINIGYSCNLLNRSMSLCRVPMVATSAQDIASAFREHFTRRRGSQVDNTQKALVISGEQITVAMRHCPDAFLEAILESTAVLACRVTPLQKAELVDFVKRQTGATSLSVGDGANDVPMLHAGNIGVGIFGREGTQAVSAADFAVRRFRDLRPLLFVHGRNALLRNSALIQFQIYKNVAFFLPQVWFALWCGFSSTTLYEPWIMTFFNLLFTSLPPLFVGLFERDLPRHLQEMHPEVYPELRSNWIFGYWTLALWFLRGLFDSTLLYFFALLAWGDDGIAWHGRAAGLAVLGNTIAIAALLVVLGRMALAIHTWTILLLFGFAWSVASFAGVLAVENWAFTWWPEQYGTVTQVINPTPLFYIALVVFICVGSEVIIPVIRREWHPDKRHLLLAATQKAEARGLRPFPSEDSRNALFP